MNDGIKCVYLIYMSREKSNDQKMIIGFFFFKMCDYLSIEFEYMVRFFKHFVDIFFLIIIIQSKNTIYHYQHLKLFIMSCLCQQMHCISFKLYHYMQGSFFQFCDLDKLAIIHKNIKPNMATNQIWIFKKEEESFIFPLQVGNYCRNVAT